MSAIYNRVGRVIAARPNWSSPVGVEYQFNTSIATARDGSEQRESMRQTARVSLSYTTLLNRAVLHRHMGDLAENQHLPFIVPSEWRRVSLAAAANTTDTTLTLDQIPAWLVASTLLVISDGATVERVTVASVGVGSVTLTAPLVTSFAIGADVFHAYSARVQETAAFRAPADQTRTAAVRLDVEPGTDPQPVLPHLGATFESRELFLVKPNWRDEPETSFWEERENVDSGVGLIEVGSPRRDHVYTLQLGFTTKSADETEALIAMFLRMKGRRDSFWMPTWQQDIDPRVVAPTASSSLEVEGSGFHAAYNSSLVYTVLAVMWGDGTIQVNRIASMNLDVSLNTVLTMTDPWIADVDATAQVMWCPLWRFASDVLEVNWMTTRAAEMTFATQTLANEAP